MPSSPTPYPPVDAFTEWDQILRRIIQDPASADRVGDWEAAIGWARQMAARRARILRAQYHWPDEDINQLIAEGVVKALEEYDPTKDPHPTRHVVRRVGHLLQDTLRRLRRQVPSPAPLTPRIPQQAEVVADPADPVVRNVVLEQAMRRMLTTMERTVIRLTFWGQWPDGQIQALFGWSEEAIRKARERALAKLRRWYEIHGLVEGG